MNSLVNNEKQSHCIYHKHQTRKITYTHSHTHKETTLSLSLQMCVTKKKQNKNRQPESHQLNEAKQTNIIQHTESLQ